MAKLTNVFSGPGRPEPKVMLGSGSEPSRLSFEELGRQQAMADNEYGYEIRAVTLPNGTKLPHPIVGTLMRIDLPQPIALGQSLELSVSCAFNYR
jgi:hypothetical protein